MGAVDLLQLQSVLLIYQGDVEWSGRQKMRKCSCPLSLTSIWKIYRKSRDPLTSDFQTKNQGIEHRLSYIAIRKSLLILKAYSAWYNDHFLTSMHIKSSPAHIRLEIKMTSIIWQKDFSVIVSDSWGQMSSFESLFDGTWILNAKQFKSKIYVYSWKLIVFKCL